MTVQWGDPKEKIREEGRKKKKASFFQSTVYILHGDLPKDLWFLGCSDGFTGRREPCYLFLGGGVRWIAGVLANTFSIWIIRWSPATFRVSGPLGDSLVGALVNADLHCVSDPSFKCLGTEHWKGVQPRTSPHLIHLLEMVSTFRTGDLCSFVPAASLAPRTRRPVSHALHRRRWVVRRGSQVRANYAWSSQSPQTTTE